MDLERLSRRDPQSVCKKYKIPASTTDKITADALKSPKFVETMDLPNEAGPKEHSVVYKGNVASGLKFGAVHVKLAREALDFQIDFHCLPRSDLQSLCKKNKIRANMTNKAMADALKHLQSVKKKAKRSKLSEKKLRKKSGPKHCEITKISQGKEIVAPCVESKENNELLEDKNDTRSCIASMEIEEQEPQYDWRERHLGMECDPLPVEKGASLSNDIIFLILSLVPTEAIMGMESVCRYWAQLISDPLFILAHCSGSHPGPITSFFTLHYRSDMTYPDFKPFLSSCPKVPSIITQLTSNGFWAASNSHGLVCFYRMTDGVIILANPATSHWALVPTLVPPSPTDDQSYDYALPALVYDPALSFHFKLAVGVYGFPRSSTVRFHIYSSETSSWTMSSILDDEYFEGCSIQADTDTCKASRIGGGSVCFKGEKCGAFFLYGYEIANDTYWKVPLPWSGEHRRECPYLPARDGEVYFVVFYFWFTKFGHNRNNDKVIVRKLDEKKSWVLEGEASTKELQKLGDIFRLPHVSYDAVRKALIIGVERKKMLHAFYLSSSTLEVLGEEYRSFVRKKLPHANTLASFHGGKRDIHALDEFLHHNPSPDVEAAHFHI